MSLGVGSIKIALRGICGALRGVVEHYGQLLNVPTRLAVTKVAPAGTCDFGLAPRLFLVGHVHKVRLVAGA